MHINHQLGGGGEGVAPLAHRGGAGVVGPSDYFQLEHGAAGDAGDHADGRAGAVQVGALFDVQLKVGGQFAGAAGGIVHPRQIAADVGHTLGQGDALGVYRGQVLRLQHSGHGAAADEPAVKAGAFLVGEHDRFDGVAGGAALLGEGAHHFDGAQHT